jgi:hypothetical protein
VYDDPSSPDEPRRNSDPSSNRPSEYRRRKTARTRSPSPAGSDVEVLPDRFDKDGRPLDRSGGAEQEMVERVVRDFGDVVDGRKTWRDLIGGLVADVGDSGGSGRRR